MTGPSVKLGRLQRRTRTAMGKEVLDRAEQRRVGHGRKAELGQRREAERAIGAEVGQ